MYFYVTEICCSYIINKPTKKYKDKSQNIFFTMLTKTMFDKIHANKLFMQHLHVIKHNLIK